jgi:hypothetical protein
MPMRIHLHHRAKERLLRFRLMEKMERKHLQGLSEIPSPLSSFRHWRGNDIIVELGFPLTPSPQDPEVLPQATDKRTKGFLH